MTFGPGFGLKNGATAALFCALLALAGCVTETSGGFNVEVSNEQALKDYIALARGYLDNDDLASAKRHLNNAAALDRNNAEVYSIWGLVYAREGEAELADESFRRSLRINGSNSQARNNYAAFLFSNGRFEDAYRQLETVVQDTTYPARPQAFENLGLAALRISDVAAAEAAFTRAVQLNSNQVRSILELAGISLSKQDLRQAGTYYRNYLTILQFYNQAQNARSLWIGIQLALAEGNDTDRLLYAGELEAAHRASPEYALYQQLLETLDND
jgi:type IV pilus assembly protein PilF